MAAPSAAVVDIVRRIAAGMVKLFAAIADSHAELPVGGYISGTLRLRYRPPFLAFRLDQLWHQPSQ